MLGQAVERAARIGIIATVAAAGPTTASLLQAAAAERGKTIDARVEVITEAFDALKQGRGEEHDALIRERALRLAGQRWEVIVLAQITMARAARVLDDLPVPVLSSPQSGVLAVMKQIRAADRRATSRNKEEDAG